MKGRLAALVFLGAVALAPWARATVTQYWTLETADDFLKCKSRGAALGGDARAAVGPAVDTVGDTGDPMVWAVTTGAGGAIFAGTGHTGKVYRADGGARLHEWAATGEPEVLSLAADGAGGVYAGTGPKGKIFHVDRSGKVSLYSQLDAEYVWALLPAKDGTLYAGTGAQGKILRIAPGGKAQEYWDSPSGHILCLAWGPRGALLAGGEESGVVYEITGPEHGRALFDTGEQEARSIAVTAKGDIYVAALKVALQLPGPPTAGGATPPAVSADKGSKSVLFRLLPNGAGVHVWDGPGLVYSLQPDGDGVVAAMGEESQLWRFDATGDAVRLLELGAGSVLSLARAGEGWIIGTGNPGEVLRVSGRGRGSAVVKSTTLDGRRVAAWGGLFPDATPAAEVQFSVRSGNSDPPDAGWSEWAPYHSGNVPAPPARYLQWKAELRGGATLRRVRVAWREQNLPPEVHAVTVLPQEPRALMGPPDGGPTVSQMLSGGIRVDYSLPRSSPRPATFDVSAWARGIRTVRWDASDPNADPLEFKLEYRRVGETTWKPLADQVDDMLYAWDTTSLPDGIYEVRVGASDSTQNSPSESLMSTRVSEPVTVDHTPPRWTGTAATRVSAGASGAASGGASGGALRIVGSAHDELSPLAYLGYSLDGRDWHLVEPVDGVLDSPDEEVRFVVPDVGPGEHTLTLKAVDLSGNVGSISITVH